MTEHVWIRPLENTFGATIGDFTAKGNRCCFSTDHCLECKGCGEYMMMPLGCMEWASDVIKAFRNAHEACAAETAEPAK